VERFKEFSGQEDCEEAAHALGCWVGLPFENSTYIKAMRNDPTQVKGRALVVSRELLQLCSGSIPWWYCWKTGVDGPRLLGVPVGNIPG